MSLRKLIISMMIVPSLRLRPLPMLGRRDFSKGPHVSHRSFSQTSVPRKHEMHGKQQVTYKSLVSERRARNKPSDTVHESLEKIGDEVARSAFVPRHRYS